MEKSKSYLTVYPKSLFERFELFLTTETYSVKDLWNGTPIRLPLEQILGFSPTSKNKSEKVRIFFRRNVINSVVLERDVAIELTLPQLPPNKDRFYKNLFTYLIRGATTFRCLFLIFLYHLFLVFLSKSLLSNYNFSSNEELLCDAACIKQSLGTAGTFLQRAGAYLLLIIYVPSRFLRIRSKIDDQRMRSIVAGEIAGLSLGLLLHILIFGVPYFASSWEQVLEGFGSLWEVFRSSGPH